MAPIIARGRAMTENTPTGGVGLLWDESFLWGVMAYRALREAGLPFRFVRAADIANGSLRTFSTLFVPGGWASKKIIALGDNGVAAIRAFINDGGRFIGICGGAGLATTEGMALLDVKRRPTSRRVPSFSGAIRLSLLHDAASDLTGSGGGSLWHGIADPVFHAWWPSQFTVGDTVSVLAKYGDALSDAFSSDLNVGDTIAAGGWERPEQSYGINLDPKRMFDEPAVVAGHSGRGTILLSLVHFDTPGDLNGRCVLRNLWQLSGEIPEEGNPEGPARHPSLAYPPPLASVCPSLAASIGEVKEAVDGVIELGLRNFLWFRRTPFILQWRRGVRGLEYCTLKVLTDEIASIISGAEDGRQPMHTNDRSAQIEKQAACVQEQLKRVTDVLLPFVREARLLLLLERQAMRSERLTYEESSDPRIRAMRERLFSGSKSHGGLFKTVLDRLDSLLYSLLCVESGLMK
jgi:putative intracellular protease/amidase